MKIEGVSENININVIIADRPYRLKVKPEEEENVRLAAKNVNEKVKEFQNTYEAKDKQDYLAMAALLFAVDNASGKLKQAAPGADFIGKLNELDNILTEILQP